MGYVLALILGIDHFMFEARALTNLIGNGVTTLVVAKWPNELDEKRLQAGLSNDNWVESDQPRNADQPQDRAYGRQALTRQ